MKKLILSLAATVSLSLGFNAQATNAETEFRSSLLTLAVAGGITAALEAIDTNVVEIPLLARSTAHISTLLYTIGTLAKSDIWKEKALKFPLAVVTLAAVNHFGDSATYIPYFGDALAKMPRESLIGLETLVFFIHGTDYAYTMRKDEIRKFMGWQID